MNHRPISVIAVVALVVLAGCSGLVPGGNSAGNGTTATQTTQSTATDMPTQMTTPTATDKAPTTTSTAGPTAASTSGTTQMATTGATQTTQTTTGNGTQSEMFPPGYAASGITNPQRAIEAHRAALSASGSYTITLNLSTTKRQFDLVRQVNITNKRLYTTLNASIRGSSFGLHTATYQTGNTRYTKTTISNRSRYNVTTQPFAASGANRSVGRTAILGNVSYGDAKRVTRNGETLFRYQSTELSNASALLPIAAANVTVESFNATVLVTKEGVIRSYSYSIAYTTASGQRQTNTATVRFSHIGTTSVEAPAWLDEAKAQTGLSTGTNATTTSSG